MVQLFASPFTSGSDSKKSTYNAGNLDVIPRLGKSPGEGHGNRLQYSGLENSMDSIVHEILELGMTERLSTAFISRGSLGKLLRFFKPQASHL